jgi:hypothetical protein
MSRAFLPAQAICPTIEVTVPDGALLAIDEAVFREVARVSDRP